MTTGQHPEDHGVRDSTGDSKPKLAMWLAILTLVLVILLIVFFAWWNREGEETDPEDVTRIELVDLAWYQMAA